MNVLMRDVRWRLASAEDWQLPEEEFEEDDNGFERAPGE